MCVVADRAIDRTCVIDLQSLKLARSHAHSHSHSHSLLTHSFTLLLSLFLSPPLLLPIVSSSLPSDDDASWLNREENKLNFLNGDPPTNSDSRYFHDLQKRIARAGGVEVKPLSTWMSKIWQKRTKSPSLLQTFFSPSSSLSLSLSHFLFPPLALSPLSLVPTISSLTSMPFPSTNRRYSITWTHSAWALWPLQTPS
jgi:hypothetical protein